MRPIFLKQLLRRPDPNNLQDVCHISLQSPAKVLRTPCYKSPFPSHFTRRQYLCVRITWNAPRSPSPPPPGKYLCGLKTTLIGGGGGEGRFSKESIYKTMSRWKCPNIFVGDCSSSSNSMTVPQHLSSNKQPLERCASTSRMWPTLLCL